MLDAIPPTTATTHATALDHPPSNDLLAAALAYAAKGWRVIHVHTPQPGGGCSCLSEPCESPGKHPRVHRWPDQATTDPQVLTRIWTCWPDANVGLVLGDGLIDIECDPRHGGDDSLRLLEQRLGGLPDTVTWISGGGGEHRLFRVPLDARIPTVANIGREVLGVPAQGVTGIDVRAAGGFAVAPPSRHRNGMPYRFGALHPDAIEVADLPSPWLAYLNRSSRAEPGAIAERADGRPIPDGARNATLTSIAGHLRRGGLSEAEMLPALEAINGLRCQPPLEDAEVARIAHSVGRYPPDQVTVAVAENWAATTLGTVEHTPPTIAALCAAKPALRPPLIDGILRLGETMNVIAAPKVGKSWLVTDLALAVATGRPWLGYATQQRDVLILDNELHGETSAHRIPKVAAARGLGLEDYGHHLCVENLRGRLTDLFRMAAYFDRIPVGRYGLIVLDAFYRFLPSGSDENDNGTMSSLYNAIDRHAERLGCGFALIHHSSKGNQSGKAVTDVGAGAGAQSRATDTHLVLRPHEEEQAVVLDAAVRSWPPLQAQVLRWTFPVWTPASDLDPSRLKPERPRRERTGTTAGDAAPVQDLALFVHQVLTAEPLTRPALVERGRHAGWSQRRVEQVLTLAEQQGVAHRWITGPTRAHAFARVPQGDPRGEGSTHTP
jgi:hypothetical protein